MMKILFPLVLLLFSEVVLAEKLSTETFAIETPAERIDAPNFSLQDLSGNTIQLRDYHGQVVLLNFWATWCGPCRKEMPGMERLWQKFREQGFVILAVSADKGSAKRVKKFVQKYNLSYPVLLDSDADTQKLYDVIGLPMSYIIGRDGKISGRIIGTKHWDSPAAYSFMQNELHK